MLHTMKWVLEGVKYKGFRKVNGVKMNIKNTNNKTKSIKLTQEYVKYLFNYDHTNGTLIWKVKKSHRNNIGDIAGTKSPHARGYHIVYIDGVSFLLHRVIWLYHNGFDSEFLIDHKDRNRTNNKIENLREASYTCNNKNCKLSKLNKTGYRGISYKRNTQKWVANITINYKQIYLGSFKSKDEAIYTRLAVEQCLGWETCVL